MNTASKNPLRRNVRNISLADALQIIKPERSSEAHIVLTVCCLYLQLGVVMPVELRRWLDLYLTNERQQIAGARAYRMANLQVVIRKAQAAEGVSRKIKLSRVRAEYAAALDLDESTVKKWQKGPASAAVTAVSDHMHLMIFGKKPP